MYHESYSFKSGISEGIRADLAGVVRYSLELYQGVNQNRPKTWLDIASNDGTLLSNVPADVYRIGIDPLTQFAREARHHADYIVTDFFDPSYFVETENSPLTPLKIGEIDVITSISMFYDLDDPNEFVAGVAKVLADDGLWVIQQNYLPTMLQNNAVDNISHEHLTYFSLSSLVPLLEHHGLEVIDVSLNPINGGCFRMAVTKKGHAEFSPAVPQMLQWEHEFFKSDPFSKFYQSAYQSIDAIRQYVLKAIDRGETGYVYGASTRGGVIWQAADLGVGHLPKVVERNGDKVGRYMSAIGSPIISEEEMRTDPPDYLLVGPYWLREWIIPREREYLASGGRLVFPLPHLEEVTQFRVS